MITITELRMLPTGVLPFAALIFSAPVFPAAGESEATSYMEEVVVTAQKRQQNLQDVAASVSAFSGDTIEKLGIRQSVDITAQTPNFNVGYPNGDSGIPAMYIRGVGLNDYGVLNSGPVATYSDQVYLASNALQIFQLLDVERVEVLRGPQGTLYGRNANGGAVNFISRKPGDSSEGWLQASAGTFGTTKLSAAFGGAINDQWGARLALVKNDSDGWLENQVTGHELNGFDTLGYRLLISFNPSDDLDFLLNFHGGQVDSDSVAYQHRGTVDPADLATPCDTTRILNLQCTDVFGYRETDDYDEGSYDFEGQNNTDFWGVSLTVNKEVGDVLITSISAWDEVDNSRPEETDSSPNDFLTAVLAVQQESFSQEIRFSRETDDYSWIVGFYYLNDDATDQTTFDLFRMLRPDIQGLDALLFPDTVEYPGGFYVPIPGISTPLPSPFYEMFLGVFIFESLQLTKQEVTSFAAFVDASWKITDAWQLSLGLRYTDEEMEQVMNIWLDPLTVNVPWMVGITTKKDFNNLSGRVVVDFTPRDNLMFYGSITSGFKAGGVNNDIFLGQQPYDDESLISYEVGLKSTLLGGLMRFNASAFLYDYKDLQVFTFINTGATPASILTNAANASISGLEAELQIFPMENLFVNLGVGLLDTEYEDYLSFAASDTQGNPIFDDFSGNEVTLAPDLTFNGIVSYDWYLPNNASIRLQTDFNYQDDVFFDSANSPVLKQDGYWMWNARIAYATANDQWEVAFWGRNLGNEEYLVYAFDLSDFGFQELMLGTPRTVGLSVDFKF